VAVRFAGLLGFAPVADPNTTIGGVPEPGKTRLRTTAFIAVIVALQTLIPLGYYLGDDPYDERFSWRMFSAVRVVRCRAAVTEKVGEAGSVRQVPLMTTIHEAWVSTLQRNRAGVIQAFLRRRCEEPDVTEVTLVNHCVNAGGTPIDPIEWARDCESAEVTAPDNPYPRAEEPGS